jgi:hypothetical protein
MNDPSPYRQSERANCWCVICNQDVDQDKVKSFIHPSKVGCVNVCFECIGRHCTQPMHLIFDRDKPYPHIRLHTIYWFGASPNVKGIEQ